MHPHIVFNDGRQQRQTQPYSDHTVCLLTDDSNKPNIIRRHIVLNDGRKQRHPNFITTT